ncbi:MAG: hypothetical protein AAFU78_04895, partial [Cyanobacteria bacterium J06633_2]
MTHLSSPPPDPNAGRSSRRLSRPLKTVVILGGILVVGGNIGAIAAQYFVYNRLTPIVENALSNTLNRPVELGDVQGFSLSGINIDGAVIPPTEEDESYARADSVQVGFGLVNAVSNLVRDRTLPITLTLIDPEVYGYEDENGQWLRLDIQQPEEEAAVTIALDRIQVKNATIALAPYPQSLDSPWENPEFYDAVAQLRSPSQDLDEADARSAAPSSADDSERQPSPTLPIVLQNIDADATLKENNRFADFDIAVRPDEGAPIFVEGSADIRNSAVQVVVRTTGLQVAPFTDLLPIPGAITDGSI